MKTELSVTATVYEKENSCLEDILAIADEMKGKSQGTAKTTAAARDSYPGESTESSDVKSAIQ